MLIMEFISTILDEIANIFNYYSSLSRLASSAFLLREFVFFTTLAGNYKFYVDFEGMVT